MIILLIEFNEFLISKKIICNYDLSSIINNNFSLIYLQILLNIKLDYIRGFEVINYYNV